ncbi:MAG TPA: ABC transporter ATP-binding protein, partial [Pilimelia sp.]|nr:ABC transporter ATP-binding protein [Pilimelia sp.]
PAPRLSAVPGVAQVEITAADGGGRLRFALTGPPAPALRALAAADLESIAVREPSLEEIFLAYYGGPAR